MSRRLNWMLCIVSSVALLGCAPGPSDQPQPQVVQPPQPPPVPIVPDSGSGRLVVLMITDNTDHVNQSGPGSIAVGVQGNAAVMAGFFYKVRQATGQQMDLHTIVGTTASNGPYNCANINQTIQALPVQPGDTVVVYYAGHGFNFGTQFPETTRSAMVDSTPAQFNRTWPTDMPFLYCGPVNRNSVNLDMIAAWLAPKNPRLTILIADACNSYEAGTGPEPVFAAAARPFDEQPDLRLISLFREAQGNVMMAGAEPGNFSFYQTAGDARGIFTRQLLDTMDGLPKGQRTSWAAVNSLFKTVPVTAKRPGTNVLVKYQQHPILRERAPFSGFPAPP